MREKSHEYTQDMACGNVNYLTFIPSEGELPDNPPV